VLGSVQACSQAVHAVNTYRPRLQVRVRLSNPGGGNVTDRESNPRSLGASSGDSTTNLKRSAVMNGTGIHR